MAFLLQKWTRVSASNATDFTVDWTVTPGVLLVSEGGPKIFTYSSTTDTQANFAAANYFNSVNLDLQAGDYIFTTDNTGVGQIYEVTVVTYGATGVVTLAAFGAAIGIIGNANINNNSINAAKLVNNSITDTQIQALGITAASIANNTLTSTQIAPSVIQFATGTITAAQFNGMSAGGAAARPIVAAQGANTLIRIHDFTMELVFGTTQFAAGGAVGLEYGTTALLAGPAASATIPAASFTGAAASSVMGALGALPVALTAATTVNVGVFMSNTTQAFTTGDSTFNWYVSYSVYTTT
jgi:hypothetical protein